jgi:hypothetical protein
MPKSLNLAEQRYRWEALKRSEPFRNELTSTWRQFLKNEKLELINPNKLSDSNFIKFQMPYFIRTRELKNLARRFNIDTHAPFEELLTNNGNNNTWEPKVIDSGVKLIGQQSDNFRIGLAIKDDNMIVNIDIRKPIKQILIEIESLLTIHGKEKGKKSPSYDLNDFNLYDMSQDLSPWEITKRLHPEIIDKSYRTYAKNYDPEARRLHKQIADAITRAKSEIAAIQ